MSSAAEDAGDRGDAFDILPIRLAYDFLAGRGFENDVLEIRTSKDKYKSYTSTLKRARVLRLLEDNGLLDDFIREHWPAGTSDQNASRMRFLRRLYVEFYVVDPDSSSGGGTATANGGDQFAYEADLQNYLVRNLGVIEKGMQLYRGEDGTDGIEFAVDEHNKRIDILATDAQGVPVVIELKVSRGYERVIGQTLYYRSQIKRRFKTDRVRIAIVARHISNRLVAAVEEIPDVMLFEYDLSVALRPVRGTH